MSALPVDGLNPAVERVFAKCGDLAVLPQVVIRIMEMTGSDDSSAQALERAIVVDPGFSAKILKQANSAYYALPRKVTNIREAVMFLGFKSVRQLAMAVGVFDLFVGKTDKESLRRRAWWRHSLDSAICSRMLAPRVPNVNADEAYTCGLLHYIGKTLLDRSDSKEYEKVTALQEKGVSDCEAERAVFACDHVEVAMEAATRWGFPQVLIDGLSYKSPPSPACPYRHLAALTALADRIATLAVDGTAREAWTPESVPAWALGILIIAPDEVPILIEQGAAAIADAASSHV